MIIKIEEIVYKNSWYNTGGNIILRIFWYLVNVQFIKCPWNLDIDNYAWIGKNVWIDNLVKERFTWGHIADQTFEIYKWLTEGGKLPSLVKLD